MTPKEKAKQLVEFCYVNLPDKHPEDTSDIHEWLASRKLALMCVAEIIQALESFSYNGAMYDDFETGKITITDEKLPEEYWKQVRLEIEQL